MIVIYGEPMGKQRPRVTRGHAYTPEKTVNYETLVKETWAMNPFKVEGLIKAEIRAYYSIPKSISKKKKKNMLSNLIRPEKKPDIDNIAKIILDSLNGLAYDDDKQIVDLHVSKWYSEVPRVEVEILEAEECCVNE